MWDNRVFTQVESITNRNFIVTMGHWVRIQQPTFFVNIYGPQTIPEKAKLWEELTQFKQSKSGI